MPALPDQPGILKITLLYSVGEDIAALCRFFLQYGGTPPSNASCVTIATTIRASHVTRLNPYMSSANSILGATVTDLTSPTSGFGEDLATTAGGLTANPLPAEACLLINLELARRYRGGKPRIYLPLGDSGELLDPTKWTTTFQNNVHTAFQLFVDDLVAITTGGITISGLANISYYSGFTAVVNPITGRTRDVPKVRSAAIAPDPITNFSVNPRVASQRRRQLHSS